MDDWRRQCIHILKLSASHLCCRQTCTPRTGRYLKTNREATSNLKADSGPLIVNELPSDGLANSVGSIAVNRLDRKVF
jgi:hypothetical protein